VKTADTIEQQGERKKARDNGHSSPANTQPITQKRKHGDFSRIAAWAWKPGQSGNPNGRPKHDVASEIAKAIFENNPELIYRAYVKAVAKGNAYAFKELADRAYGKLKETHQVDVSPYKDMSDEDLAKRIKELEQQLGYVKVLPPADDEPKPN
jgi:hypothetical protein